MVCGSVEEEQEEEQRGGDLSLRDKQTVAVTCCTLNSRELAEYTSSKSPTSYVG